MISRLIFPETLRIESASIAKAASGCRTSPVAMATVAGELIPGAFVCSEGDRWPNALAFNRLTSANVLCRRNRRCCHGVIAPAESLSKATLRPSPIMPTSASYRFVLSDARRLSIIDLSTKFKWLYCHRQVSDKFCENRVVEPPP